MGEYQLDLIPDGSAVLRFCPWCGGAFPQSQRSSFFTNPTPEDLADVRSITSRLKNVDDMRQQLGEPDLTVSAQQDNRNWVKQNSYSKRWPSLTLHIQEKLDGTLSISYCGSLLDDGGAALLAEYDSH